MVSAIGCGDGGTHAPADTGLMLGAIEGFYGDLYSFDERTDLLRFLPRAGLNTYVYAPKSDPYHRARWREPYPDEWMAHFADLAVTGRTIGVRFVFALSPGSEFDPEAGDAETVRAKLGTLLDVGVRDFCLFFDDLNPNSRAADPSLQVELVSQTFDFIRARDPDGTLCFISHYYAGTAAEIAANHSPFDGSFAIPSSAAYAAYASMPPDIRVFWTGPRVFASPLRVADAADLRALVAHPLLIWDNFPVNDVVLSRELFLGPYRDREAGITTVVDGVLLNTMIQPEASKVALWTAGRFFAGEDAYDPDEALARALEVVAGDRRGARVVARIAAQFASHPLIGTEQESARMAALGAGFLATRSAASERALRTLLQSYANTADDLAHDVHNPHLVAELSEPARKLALFGQAGLLALDLLALHAAGLPVDENSLRQQLAAANAIGWLVGANTPIGRPLDEFLAGHPAVRADVFGDFFAAVFSQLEEPAEVDQGNIARQ